jgi:hypothetical protein
MKEDFMKLWIIMREAGLMKQVKFELFSTVLLVSLVLSSCASQNLPAPHARLEPLDPQDKLLIEKKVNDARYLSIDGFEHMKVNRALLEQVELYDTQKTLFEKKDFVAQFLQDAAELNDQVIRDAATKLSNEELTAFIDSSHTSYTVFDQDVDFDPNVPGDTPQERFVNGYRKHADEEFKKELNGFLSLQTVAEIDTYWQTLVRSIEESIMTKGRTMRMISTGPLVPFVYAWIWYHAETDDRSAHKPDFLSRTLFKPESKPTIIDPKQITSDWTLLEYYAPVVVQESTKNPSYDPAVDRFGEVWLEGSRDTGVTPHVDTDKPTVYAYADRVRIQGVVTRQLVYTLWYPEHPKLHTFDPEAGPMEGLTMRITLNQDNRPLLFESVSACGCYYKVFPTERLEEWSSKEYPEKLKEKTFHLENTLPGKIDVLMPELVALASDPIQKVVLYYSAGKHQLVTIRPISELSHDDHSNASQNYRLVPYEALENLRIGKYNHSLFDENGLVLGAHRPECYLLTPSGLFHAGHPRQRNTQMIYFDQAEFDDQQLLETYLRLPPEIASRP